MRLSRSPPHHRQHGVAVLILLTIILMVLLAGLVAGLPTTDPQARLRADSARALADAKAALIAWALAHPTQPGRLPMPDRNSDNTYDDVSDCSAPVLDSHLLGRLPIRGEISGGSNCLAPLPFGPETAASDGGGDRLWYAAARHLVRDGTVPGSPTVVPSLINNPNNWLAVSDADGNLIDAQVAFVVIAPGTAVDGQNRGAAAPNADDYLDSVNDGTPQFAANYDADLSFVTAFDRVTTTNSDDFNDLVAFASAAEFLAPLIRYALAETGNALRAFHAANAGFPDAAPAADGVCQAGLATGFLPVAPGTCGAALSLPGWLDPNWLPELGYQRVNANLARLTVIATAAVVEITP